LRKPMLQLLCVFLAFAVLTGCGAIPGKQEVSSEKQDVFISQVPLVPKDKLSDTAGASSTGETQIDSQEDLSEKTPETNTMPISAIATQMAFFAVIFSLNRKGESKIIKIGAI